MAVVCVIAPKTVVKVADYDNLRGFLRIHKDAITFIGKIVVKNPLTKSQITRLSREVQALLAKE